MTGPAELPRKVAAAVAARGHDLHLDPIASGAPPQRWTCTHCTRAILVRGNGTYYGSAGDIDCTTNR